MRSIELPLVCVIDDEGGVRSLVSEILESHGFASRCYASADEFLAEFDESITACIVADLRMPGLDGVQLYQRLRAMGSIVAVVVLTGNVDVRTAVQLMRDGVLTLLEKPFRRDELVAAVEKSAEVTAAQQESRGAASGATPA